MRTLLLDIGRVVAEFDHMKPCLWISSKTGRSVDWIHNQVFSTHGPASRHEEGGSSQQFFEEVCELTNLETDFETFAEAWSNIFAESQDIRRILGNVGSHITMGIVSNTDPLHWQRLKKLPVMQEYFKNDAHVTTSFSVRTRKPNVAIYEHALRSLNSTAAQTLYIDDVDSYVHAFRRMGGKGEVYNCDIHNPLRLERILKYHGYI